MKWDKRKKKSLKLVIWPLGYLFQSSTVNNTMRILLSSWQEKNWNCLSWMQWNMHTHTPRSKCSYSILGSQFSIILFLFFKTIWIYFLTILKSKYLSSKCCWCDFFWSLSCDGEMAVFSLCLHIVVPLRPDFLFL